MSTLISFARQPLGHLVDRVHGPVESQRDPRHRIVIGGTDGQGVDVEATTVQNRPGDAGQNARLVLNQDREDVFAAGTQAGDRLELVE